jgi:hypothetical protein
MAGIQAYMSGQNGNTATKAGTTALSFLSGPTGMAVTTGLGLLQGWLQGRAQSQLRNRINEVSSPDYLFGLQAQFARQQAGQFADIARAEQLGAQTAADRTRARYNRAGLSGVGDAVAQNAEIGSFLTGRAAANRLKLESLRMAQEQRNAELQALSGLMGTPYGSASPMSMAIAGAGTGLEAAVKAAYANQMSGRGGGY